MPAATLIATTRLNYLLFALGFLFGIPVLAGVMAAYATRGKTRGTFLESHLAWQLRTFWFGLMWLAMSIALLFTLVGMPLGIAMSFGAFVWIIYRVVRGWRALVRHEPVFPSRGL